MDSPLAAFPQHVERIEFGTHKGENGLLFIAEKHHRSIIVGRYRIDDSQLQKVQILHLVYLDPRKSTKVLLLFTR